jgi:phosphoribosylformylglycinamidine (FGAM) synthase PurS component
MRGTHLIEVSHKPGIKDPLAAEIQADLKEIGGKNTGTVATAKLYRLIGDLTAEQRNRVGSELLADPVVEEVHDGDWVPAPQAAKAAKNVVVDVWFKQGVTDAVGETVLKGLQDLGLDTIQDVRTGMRYRFNGLKDAHVADRLARALLFNPLIHERSIHAD